MTEDTEKKILGYRKPNEEIPDKQASGIKRLKGSEIIDAEDKWVLTDEGKTYLVDGSPEVQFFSAIPSEGISTVDLRIMQRTDLYKIGSFAAFMNKWVEIRNLKVLRKVGSVEDKVKDLLQKIEQEEVVDDKNIDALERRKLIVLQSLKRYSLRNGPNYVEKRKEVATDLNGEHLQRVDRMDLEFKEYNLNAQAQPIQTGYTHHLLKVREEIENIFVRMGFEELPTNNFIESRYECVWEKEEADKNLLQTHTTAVSTRMLYKLAQQETFSPKKYYSRDRNEGGDRTHLAEFHQIEGLICDRGLSHGDVRGVVEDFFACLGMSKLCFKPACNPCTEPSMEIFSYHEGLKKWVEIGKSGMFRHELLLPMGLPENVCHCMGSFPRETRDDFVWD